MTDNKKTDAETVEEALKKLAEAREKPALGEFKVYEPMVTVDPVPEADLEQEDENGLKQKPS